MKLGVVRANPDHLYDSSVWGLVFLVIAIDLRSRGNPSKEEYATSVVFCHQVELIDDYHFKLKNFETTITLV